jgi:hypothetical protein
MSNPQSKPWMICPKCGGDNVELEVRDIENTTLTAWCRCADMDCFFHWIEIYEFICALDFTGEKVLDENGNQIENGS